MIKLPKRERNSKDTEGLCKCRPTCKSRRREWKGKIQDTSAELLLERKPLAECFRRWPMKIYPNSPCPLFAKNRRIVIEERNAVRPPPHVVRICQAPVDDVVDTHYLKYAELAKKLGDRSICYVSQQPAAFNCTPGALDAVKPCCAFCSCGACCPCGPGEYEMHDGERKLARRNDMRHFDSRLKNDYQPMRIMYDKP